MKNSILMAVSDTFSSKAAVRYMESFQGCAENMKFTLVHVYRKPTAGNELMGKKFIEQQPDRYQELLETSKKTLVGFGFLEDKINTKIIDDAGETISGSIIDECRKGDYTMVVIGRRKKSKAEEFIKGDLCTKLVRELEGVAILAVRTN